MTLVFTLAAWAVFGAISFLFVSGWVRWSRRSQSKSLFSYLSLFGFTLGTASFLLAVGSVLYAHAIGGFPFHHPLLLRIYRWGFGLSSIATLLAIGGVWRPSSLRWHAGAAAVLMLAFWIVMVEGE